MLRWSQIFQIKAGKRNASILEKFSISKANSINLKIPLTPFLDCSVPSAFQITTIKVPYIIFSHLYAKFSPFAISKAKYRNPVHGVGESSASLLSPSMLSESDVTDLKI